MLLWHIYHLFPSKYWHHSNIVSLHIYHSFPSKILASFECSSVIYLPFISLKSTDIIRIWFRPIFTINFPQKFLNHFDMILSLVYDLFPSKILASFEYGFDTYLPFASHKNAGIIWIWLCYIFAICFKNTEIIWICFCYIFIINLLRNIGIVWIWFCCMLF